MKKINNVNLNDVMGFLELAKKDKSNAVKIKTIEGEWVLQDGRAQFLSELKHEKGITKIEADAPSFMGGSGIRPDPVQYCMFGLIACFAQTIALIASEKEIKLKKLKITAENQLNLLKAMNLGNEPPTKMIKLNVLIDGDNKKALEEIINEAKQRCPGIYCLTNPIPLQIQVQTPK